ncbi:hypothetical protein ABH15_08790 [Methanoculleus taiwanensis]|uniref:Aminoglycoside phosphotransferase domain-containing protein n=1 Tax=Methanoculleus taiwanensis TaxID=1550565 RepID=A0A498GZY4_9EURY|nr:aminoglycoside phosphotransferase family protein [Methanoculleus taiwanensis]RXE56231.1 hypothetical protein ABH15_08790 [Methanoculleus taiwanensis]
MESFEKIRKEVREITGFLHAEEIREGYSDERKYVLSLQGGENLLLRITEPADEAIIRRKQAEFNVIRDLGRYSDKVPEAKYFGVSKDNHLCFIVLRFIEGTAAEQCLPDLPDDVQYAIGVAAGEELKRMHAMKAPAWYPGWYETKTRKHAYYLRSLAECSAKPEGVDLDAIQAYVESGMDLMKNVESSFQHDDYHPANIIVRGGAFGGVIDFNRYDWGDPIHDFYKIAHFSRNISVPFSVGQIDGYTGGKIPNNFWKRYALYVAMSVVPDIVWSHRYSIRTGTTDQIERSQKTIQTIWCDHDRFEADVPLWYHEFRESREM